MRRVGEEDAPAVVGHLDRAIGRPALGVDRGCRAQVDVIVEETVGSHLTPPVEVMGLPGFEGALQAPVLVKIDVVRNQRLVIDGHGALSYTLFLSKLLRSPLP
jgi:hypothetical protein